jgi:predicted MPP superfamily phosphohydrolase
MKEERTEPMKKGLRLTRSDFLRLLSITTLDFFLLGIGGAVYGYLMEPNLFQVETVKLKLPRLSHQFSGLRVVQISDIHMGGWMNLERLRRVTDLIMAQKPDVLLITGDFLIGYEFDDAAEQAIEDLVEALSHLAASIPTFAVLGNHDYWTSVKAVRQMLRAAGITELTNRVFTLSRDGEHLHFCGVDDVWEGNARLEDVIAELSEDGASILLAHEPDFADISAATGRFDLQLSGHSHGGQVVLPFVGPPRLPYLGRKYPSGLYKVGEMFQYTNRGVGMARLPIRINCPPEITLFVLDSPASSPAALQDRGKRLMNGDFYKA